MSAKAIMKAIQDRIRRDTKNTRAFSVGTVTAKDGQTLDIQSQGDRDDPYTSLTDIAGTAQVADEGDKILFTRIGNTFTGLGNSPYTDGDPITHTHDV
jgi:hypothetical protein